MSINKMNISLNCYTADDYCDKASALVNCYLNCLIDYKELERCIENLFYPVTDGRDIYTYEKIIKELKNDFAYDFIKDIIDF